MIVKDEAAVIERCLGSVRGVIDAWVICDTGSSDGTQDIIRAALEGIPGDLHERPWRNFGENRTELMGLAAGRADYLLLLDADDTITVSERGMSPLGADSYMLRHDDPVEYWQKRLVRGDREWRYVGVTHEYITCDGPESETRLDWMVIHHHADGSTRREKFERDLRLLEWELRTDPGNPPSGFLSGADATRSGPRR
jgi:glycosyltransferase involved in cell wall biosynthesis